MLVKEFINKTTKTLEKNGVDTPFFDAKMIISLYFGIELNKIADIYSIKLTDLQLNKLDKIIKERINKKPISKIFNKKTFWDFDFYVNENVLDPRPDSEILIEEILKNYNKNDTLKILDLGTGSGCLILAVLKLFGNFEGTAVDISEEALKIAEKNAKNLNILDKIKFVKSNWNDKINECFDLIISNPPYIPTATINNLEDDVKKFDPLLALDGGTDGLDCYKYLAGNLKKNCKTSTKIFLEIGISQKNDVIKLFENNDLIFEKSLSDYGGIERILIFKCL